MYKRQWWRWARSSGSSPVLLIRTPVSYTHLNRAEIAEIVYDGLADPQNAAVPEGLQGYVEGAKDQWAEYDVARANQLLDEIGLKYDAKNEYLSLIHI